MSKLTISRVYLAWIIIGVISWFTSWVTGELYNLIGQSVDLVYDPGSGLTRDQMMLGFIITSLIYWIITIIVSGIFVYFSNKNKNWAKYLLTAFCIFQVYYEASIYFSIANTYDYSFGIEDILLGSLSIIALLIMAVIPHVKRYTNIS